MKERFSSKETKFIAVFAMGIVLLILITIIINTFALKGFYRKQAVRSMENAYSQINDAVAGNDPEMLQEVLSGYSEKQNISIAVYDSMTSEAVISSERDKDGLMRKLKDTLFSHDDGKTEELIVETDDYRITRTEHDITFFGYCSDNRTMVLMSSPILGMIESASQYNRFLLFEATVAIIISTLAVIFLLKKVSAVDELEKRNERLEFELEEKEKQERIMQEFVSSVSHELKTPIALIQGYAEGLSEGLCNDEESRKYYSDVIVDEADRMNRIVRQLLLLSSLESGLEKPEMKEFDISGLAEGICENSQILLKNKNIEFVSEIPGGIYAYGDELRIESVISNYISNAINHVSENGKIIVKLTKPEDRVVFSVFNTGENIPGEELERIWDKFYKVDKARTRQYGGSGLGLSIVRAVINAHGGKCTVRNLEGGVEFGFELKGAAAK